MEHNSIGSSNAYGSIQVGGSSTAILGNTYGGIQIQNATFLLQSIPSETPFANSESTYRIERQNCVYPTYTIETVTTFNEGSNIAHRGFSSQRQLRWEKKEELGAGAFAEVHREECNDGGANRSRAVKVISLARLKHWKVDYKKEIGVLVRLSHPNYIHRFVEFYAWYQHGNSVFVAMEYIAGGDLTKYIENGLTKDDARVIGYQVLDSIRCLHSLDIIHRDIKPGNIFVTRREPWWIKIGDFGICKSTVTQNTMLYTSLGTQGYQAPEILGFVPKEKATHYNAKCDVWSYGCLLYEILTTKAIFADPFSLNTYCQNSTPFPCAPLQEIGLEQKGISFIQLLLQADPRRRPSSEEAMEVGGAWFRLPSNVETPQESAQFSKQRMPEQRKSPKQQRPPEQQRFPEQQKASKPQKVPKQQREQQESEQRSHDEHKQPDGQSRVYEKPGVTRSEWLKARVVQKKQDEYGTREPHHSPQHGQITSSLKQINPDKPKSPDHRNAHESGVANDNEAKVDKRKVSSLTKVLRQWNLKGHKTNSTSKSPEPIDRRNHPVVHSAKRIEEHSHAYAMDVPLDGPPQWNTARWLDQILTVETLTSTFQEDKLSLTDMMTLDDRFHMSITNLTIGQRSRPFTRGAECEVFYAQMRVSANPYVTKSWRSQDGPGRVIEDIQLQALCKAFALEFNSLLIQPAEIDFATITYFQGLSPDLYTSLEPYLKGDYVKYNNNAGYVNNEIPDDRINQAAQAFSHYTFERSRGKLLVSDLQGIGGLLIDPAIHTRDRNRFMLSDTNLNEDGIKLFFSTHGCNQICHKLRLESTAQMVTSGTCSFRESWPYNETMTRCCYKFCDKIFNYEGDRLEPYGFSPRYTCDSCLQQVSKRMFSRVCNAGRPHYFEYNAYWYELQGQEMPSQCSQHISDDDASKHRRRVSGTTSQLIDCWSNLSKIKIINNK